MPRDELFQTSVDELFDTVMGILYLGERQRIRLFVRRDALGRFLSCLVFVPRDRFNTENRRRIETILRDAYSAASIDYTTRVSESVLVRLHYLIHTEPGQLAGAGPARARAADRRGDALVGRRPRGGADRGARRGARHRALPHLRRCVPDRLPRRLAGALGDRRHPPHRGAAHRGRPGHAAVPPGRGAARRDAGEAVSLGHAAVAVGHAAAVREHGRAGRRRAPVRDQAARGAARCGSTTSASPWPGTCELEDEPVREGFQDAFVRAWRGDARERRLQPAGPARAADLARGHGPARGRALPAPDRHDVLGPLRRAGPDRPSEHRAPARRALRGALRPRPRTTPRRRPGSSTASARPSTRSRASTRTASCASSPTSSRRSCAPTTSSTATTGCPSPRCRSSSTRCACPGCRCPGRSSRSSSTRRASRACTCAAARSPAAASAGRTGARTSAPRSSG